MILKKIKSTTNGKRHQLILYKSLLFKYNHIIKNLGNGNNTKNGHCRINGNITVRHKGNKLLRNVYKSIFHFNFSFIAIIIGILYNANTTNFISLSFDLNRKIFFLSPSIDKVYCGSLIINHIVNQESRLGFRSNLVNIPIGCLINNLTFNSSFRAVLIRSAGSFGQVLQKDFNSISVKLPSNFIIKTNIFESAYIGRNSNILNNKIISGKAGKSRYIGIRPSVRGVAMNPVDHPHGGRTKGGRPSVTPWGLPTKGVSTKKK